MQQNEIKTQLSLSKKYLLAIRYNTPEISCIVLLGEARKHLANAHNAATLNVQYKTAETYKIISKNCSGKEVMKAKKAAIDNINEILQAQMKGLI